MSKKCLLKSFDSGPEGARRSGPVRHLMANFFTHQDFHSSFLLILILYRGAVCARMKVRRRGALRFGKQLDLNFDLTYGKYLLKILFGIYQKSSISKQMAGLCYSSLDVFRLETCFIFFSSESKCLFYFKYLSISKQMAVFF